MGASRFFPYSKGQLEKAGLLIINFQLMTFSFSEKWVLLAVSIVVIGAAATVFHARTPLPTQDITVETSPTENLTTSPLTTITVHIAGAVYRPGVYEVTGNQRVMDILKLAGGPRPEADLDGVNLAAKVKDGQKIKVPEIKRVPSPKVSAPMVSEQRATQQSTAYPLSLRTASAEELTTLPGVGPALAQRIITFRESHPGASNTEFSHIKGLGEKKWNKIKPYIE